MNVYLLNTLGFGIDSIAAIRKELPVKAIIGLSRRQSSDAISGYVCMQDYCEENGIDCVSVDSYSLNTAQDRALLEALDIDVLVVVGWQRLIPKWLIDHCKICAIGIHGSPFGIVKGRGRSPQNWALLLGRREFSISIFRIDEGIDSGAVIATRVFRYDLFDDIRTSYYKASLLSARMIVDSIKEGSILTSMAVEQSHDEAEYLPQRLPEDGAIDWNLSPFELYNFVRALTRPYPGAWTTINGSKVVIYSVRPFDIDLPQNGVPGEIGVVMHDGSILVDVRDGRILIEEYCCDDPTQISAGAKFQSVDFAAQTAQIVARHETKYPDLPVSTAVKAMAANGGKGNQIP